MCRSVKDGEMLNRVIREKVEISVKVQRTRLEVGLYVKFTVLEGRVSLESEEGGRVS